MKRKSLVAILLALVLCFTMALTACNDNNDDPPGGGGGTNPTLEQVVEKLQDMPTSTDESAIENAIDEVFGVDVNLPEGTYNAQTYTVNGVSAYMVTVSGANTTAADYYNSIKAEMLAKGYIAEDSELAFYKVVGTVGYSAVVEDDGNDVIIVFGVATPTANPGTSGDPSNPSNPGSSTSGQFLTASELAEFEATGLTVPTGLTAVSKDVNLDPLAIYDKEATVMFNGGTNESFTALATALFSLGFNMEDDGTVIENVSSAILTYEGVDYMDFSTYKISADYEINAVLSMSNGVITMNLWYKEIVQEEIRTTWLTAEEKQTFKVSLDMPNIGTLTEVGTWDLSGWGVQQKRIDFYFTGVTVEQFEAYAQQIYAALGITCDEFGDAITEYDDCRGSNSYGAEQTFEGCYSYDENSSGIYYLITITHYAEAMDGVVGNQIGYDVAANSMIISFLINEI